MTEQLPEGFIAGRYGSVADDRRGSLAAALAQLQTHLPQIKKVSTGKIEGTTKAGKEFSYAYKYADLADISEALLPLLGEVGLSFIAKPTFVDGRFVLAYSLLHESGEREDGEYPLTGSTPQQIGSAITYGRRYCLCAVTGVAPEDDDDAARAVGAQAEEGASELRDARDAVRGAWSVTFGRWNQEEAITYYGRWKARKAPSLQQADAAELRRFAALLTSLPPADAGSDPTTHEPTPPAGDQPQTETSPPPLTPEQRTKINAIMTKLYGRDRAARIGALATLVGRDIESSSDLTKAEAHRVIEELEQGERS
jgi:hypothetical protein